MSTKNTLINFDGQTLFKVLQSGSFTVPDTKTSPSAIGKSSGVSPTDIFDAKRASVGGHLYATFSDTAGTASQDIQFKLLPSDIVACSAVVGGVVTVSINGENVATIACTAVAGVLGAWA